METTRRENSITKKIAHVSECRKLCKALYKLLQPYQGKFQDRLPDYVVEQFKEITDNDCLFCDGPHINHLISERQSKTSKAKVCVLKLKTQIERYEKLLHAIDSLDTLPEIDDILSLNNEIQALCDKRKAIQTAMQDKLTVMTDFIRLDHMEDKNLVRLLITNLAYD